MRVSYSRCLIGWAILVCGLAQGADYIEGVVLDDSSSRPVRGAAIRLTLVKDQLQAAEAGEDGRFRIPVPPQGPYSLDIARVGYLPCRVRLEANAPGEQPLPLLIRLIPAGSIEGEILNSAGHVPDSVRVVPLLKVGAVFRPARNDAPVDERGRYRLSGLQPGNYLIAAKFAGREDGSGVAFFPNQSSLRDAQAIPLAPGEQQRGVNLALPPSVSSRISGVVRTPLDGAGLFLVSLVARDAPGVIIAAKYTDNRRAFEFRGVRAGSYEILATGPIAARSAFGGVVNEPPLFAREAIELGVDPVEVSLTVQPGGPLTLRVSHASGSAGACGKSVPVKIIAQAGWGILLDKSTTLSAGADRVMENLAPGGYALETSDRDPGCRVDNIAQGGSSADIMMTNQWPSIEGQVIGLEGAGRPAVLLVRDAPDDVDGAPASEVAFTDGEGGFRFPVLMPGRYLLALVRARSGGPGKTAELRERWFYSRDAMKMVELDAKSNLRIELSAPPAWSSQ